MNWNCPHCNHNMTLVGENHQINKVEMQIKNKDGEKELKSIFYICSNEDCKKISLDIDLFNLDKNRDNYAGIYRYSTGSKEQTWKLLPNGLHKIYPDYIPKSLLQDYQEAYAIKELSPKASATLSRRCLQGIIRDFWGVTKGSLYEEINAIEEKIDPLLFKAIDAVRHIGNIGAHMEKDINLIIDIDSGEAEKLIKLIELLFKEFYIAKHEREKQLEEIIGIQEAKREIKKAA